MCYDNCQVMGTYLIKSMANEQRGERTYILVAMAV